MNTSLLSQLEKYYPLSQLSDITGEVKMAFLYIEENFDKWTTDGKQITLEQIASHLNVRPSSLNKKIQQELENHDIHVSCNDYLDGLRVKKAKILIRSNPHLLCRQIADKVGTGDRILRKIFRKLENKTHSEYRFEIFVRKNRPESV